MPEILQYAAVGAVGVAAVAIVLQLVVLSRLVKSIKVVEQKVQDFVGKVDPLVDQAMTTLEDSRRQIADVSARANEVLAMSRKHLETIDGVLSEAGACARQQMERTDLLFDDAMNRFQEVVNVLHSGFLKPVREINGLVSGLRAGLSQFLRGGRATVAQATHDEEMFI
jgi:ABC-type transporter Mla subunit MlaD